MDSDDLAEQMVLDAIREAKRQIAQDEERARVVRRRRAMVLVWIVVVTVTVAVWMVADAYAVMPLSAWTALYERTLP